MNHNEVQLGMTNREASLLRAALHIACALTAHSHPFARPKLSAEFDKLHGEFRDSGFGDFHREEVLAFEADILDAVRDSDNDAKLLRDLFAPPAIMLKDMDFGQLEKRVLTVDFETTGPMLLGKTVTGRINITTPAIADNLRKLPDVIADDQSARHMALVPKPTDGWVVQVNLRAHANGGDWKRVEHLGLPQTSRNAAYRAMHARAKAQGVPLALYRVVPASTTNGPEKDRGFYTVEYWSLGEQDWIGARGKGGELSRKFQTDKEANIQIESGGFPNNRYRVKWHPSKP